MTEKRSRSKRQEEGKTADWNQNGAKVKASASRRPRPLKTGTGNALIVGLRKIKGPFKLY